MKIYWFDARLDDACFDPPCVSRWSRVSLPSVKCENCGEIWASSVSIVPQDLPEDHPLRFRNKGPASARELEIIRRDIRSILNLADDVPLPPGTRFGPERLLCKSHEIRCFEWPKLHTMFIRADVHRQLTEKNLTGWNAAPVDIDVPHDDLEVPPLLQLIVTGRGGRAVAMPAFLQKSHCPVCSRTEYIDDRLESIALDEEEWDGSDIFRFDPPLHGSIFVTERMAEALHVASCTNYELHDLASFVEWRNS